MYWSVFVFQACKHELLGQKIFKKLKSQVEVSRLLVYKLFTDQPVISHLMFLNIEVLKLLLILQTDVNMMFR